MVSGTHCDGGVATSGSIRSRSQLCGFVTVASYRGKRRCPSGARSSRPGCGAHLRGSLAGTFASGPCAAASAGGWLRHGAPTWPGAGDDGDDVRHRPGSSWCPIDFGGCSVGAAVEGACDPRKARSADRGRALVRIGCGARAPCPPADSPTHSATGRLRPSWGRRVCRSGWVASGLFSGRDRTCGGEGRSGGDPWARGTV
jgi:hypothetical protein